LIGSLLFSELESAINPIAATMPLTDLLLSLNGFVLGNEAGQRGTETPYSLNILR
jgi:hypothetical protein